jgi:hypothetical protein
MGSQTKDFANVSVLFKCGLGWELDCLAYDWSDGFENLWHETLHLGDDSVPVNR